jgi:hypothetical protein
MVTLTAVARGVRRALAVLVVAAAARTVLGVWLSSIVLTGWALGAGLVAWSRLEKRLDRRERAVVPDVIHPPVHIARTGAEHVAFARGLAAVSAAYLAHCEEETNRHDRDR